MGNCTSRKEQFISLILLVIVFGLILFRIRFGIDYTDESWYVSEPYAVAQLGLKPFINNIMQAPGVTVPLAFAFKFFLIINKSTEGIVLFSRTLYLVWGTIISCLIVVLSRINSSVKLPYVFAPCLLVSLNAGSLFDLNYFTIGLMYYPLILIVLCWKCKTIRGNVLKGIVAVLIACRAIIATPQIIVGLAVILLYLCIRKKLDVLLGILLGSILAGMIFFSYIFASGGFSQFCTWIQMFFSQAYFSIAKQYTIYSTIKSVLLFLIPSIVIFSSLCLLQISGKLNLQLIRVIMLVSIIVGATISVMRQDYLGYYLGSWTWAMPYIYYLFSEKDDYKEKISVACLSYLAIFLLASFSNIYGFENERVYWLYVPVLLIAAMVYHDKDLNTAIREKQNISRLWTVALCGFIVFKVVGIYDYVYRDDDIELLTVRIEQGIWKGIRTTQNRAEDSMEVEEYLKAITSDNENVLCLDWASFGYLMINSNSKICAPTTLDASCYTYGVNNPTTYFDYFIATKNVPDSIIYIDYGRDALLSVDNDVWLFSDFVKENYIEEDSFRNDTFCVRKYSLDNKENAYQYVLNYDN